MFPQETPSGSKVESKTYPLGEKNEHSSDGHALDLVALSHTAVEHRLYSVMLASGPNGPQSFTARRLMDLTGIRSVSTIRRALEGLVAKLSIERHAKPDGNGTREPAASYIVFSPEQIISRRDEQGVRTLNHNSRSDGNHRFEKAIARLAENGSLSRREAQVALCCVEGLTNAEIGHRLEVSEQTVKFHLRHVFVKFGVKRRTELISRLLM
jgi:DNA-binding CsgD family transcriptional regulator